jgi:glycosyltransferase involved in cell wall biosynthesis
MDVSVIVPTFNRSASVGALLDDLSAQQAADLTWEALIVDNGSSDDTRAVVEGKVRTDSRFRYILESRPGASHARNAGIAAASAPILAFIDDDVRPRRDWIAAIAAAFTAHPEVDCIGGRVEPRWPRTPPRWLTSAHWAPLALQIGRGSSRYLDRDHASACLVTANFACRAAVFREIGGFSPAFMRDEDREFNLRMWRAGKRGMYVDTVGAYAEVQPERLEKRYHRRWYHVTGASHARLWYRDVIDADGRIDDTLPSRARAFLGVPGFLYRELAAHARGWIAKMLSGRFQDAFADECRLRYLIGYVRSRLSDPASQRPTTRLIRAVRGRMG